MAKAETTAAVAAGAALVRVDSPRDLPADIDLVLVSKGVGEDAKQGNSGSGLARVPAGGRPSEASGVRGSRTLSRNAAAPASSRSRP